MPNRHTRLSDERIDQIIGRLLQFGVMLAGAVVTVAAAFYLVKHGGDTAAYGAFHVEPGDPRTIAGILHGAATTMHPRAWIQLGLLILLLTPVARVVLLLGAFALQRDALYVGIATVVLLVLVASLAGLMP